MPPEGTLLIDPCHYSSVIKHYYENAQSHIQKPRAAVDWESYNATSSYSDPALTDSSVLGAYAVKLWQEGALAFLHEGPEEYVDLFTVIKSDGPEGRKSRVVWDERRFNHRCRAPPKMPMGSPSCFSHWDLGLGRRSALRFASTTGDLPDWFTRIRCPAFLFK